MHEFGVTQTIINNLLHQLQRDQVTKVLQVTFQRSSAFSEDVLRQSFDILSAGTPLYGAELVIDIAVLNVTCGCGLVSTVHSEDLLGHMFVCPNCGAVREIAEAHDLELISVTAEIEEESVDGIQA